MRALYFRTLTTRKYIVCNSLSVIGAKQRFLKVSSKHCLLVWRTECSRFAVIPKTELRGNLRPSRLTKHSHNILCGLQENRQSCIWLRCTENAESLQGSCRCTLLLQIATYLTVLQLGRKVTKLTARKYELTSLRIICKAQVFSVKSRDFMKQRTKSPVR